jgi:TonB family protein
MGSLTKACRIWFSHLRNVSLSAVFLLVAPSTFGLAQISSAGSEPPPYDTPPTLLHQEQGRYTAEARQANISGKVILLLNVDRNGLPSHVHVVKGLSMGLDERALEAVRQDRFKPAMKDGKPVLASIKFEVTFDPIVNPGP